MSECTYSGPSGRCHWRDEVVPALTAERDRLWVEIKRCEGALADAATVPTDNVEHGIRLLTQQLAGGATARQRDEQPLPKPPERLPGPMYVRRR